MPKSDLQNEINENSDTLSKQQQNKRNSSRPVTPEAANKNHFQLVKDMNNILRESCSGQPPLLANFGRNVKNKNEISSSMLKSSSGYPTRNGNSQNNHDSHKSQVISRTHPGHVNGTSRTRQGHLKDMSGDVNGHIKYMSRAPQGHVKGTSRTCQEM